MLFKQSNAADGPAAFFLSNKKACCAIRLHCSWASFPLFGKAHQDENGAGSRKGPILVTDAKPDREEKPTLRRHFEPDLLLRSNPLNMLTSLYCPYPVFFPKRPPVFIMIIQ